jgi:hypothetical protein
VGSRRARLLTRGHGGGKPGTGVIGVALATDGRFIYFSWAERAGDIWIMDVMR